MSDVMKRMADLIKSGAVMLAEKCPVEGCHYPLFRLKSGETICPVHGRVYVVKTDEEAISIKREISLRNVLDLLEERIIEDLYRLSNELRDSVQTVMYYLELLERIRRLKSTPQ